MYSGIASSRKGHKKSALASYATFESYFWPRNITPSFFVYPQSSKSFKMLLKRNSISHYFYFSIKQIKFIIILGSSIIFIELSVTCSDLTCLIFENTYSDLDSFTSFQFNSQQFTSLQHSLFDKRNINFTFESSRRNLIPPNMHIFFNQTWTTKIKILTCPVQNFLNISK